MTTIFASAARTASANSNPVGSAPFVGGIFTLDISARSGTTPTLDVKLQYRDPLSGAYTDIPGASFAQKTAVGTDTLTVYPNVVATANRSVPLVLGDEFRVVTVVGGTTPSFTYTLSFQGVK